jgi:putative endonuclease
MKEDAIYYVYAIKSMKDNRIYVGMTHDIETRIKQHNQGLTRSTKGFTPWEIIYVEKVGERSSARKESYI